MFNETEEKYDEESEFIDHFNPFTLPGLKYIKKYHHTLDKLKKIETLLNLFTHKDIIYIIIKYLCCDGIESKVKNKINYRFPVSIRYDN